MQVAVSDAHHYAFRDWRLRGFNAYEFFRTFQVRRMTKADEDWAADHRRQRREQQAAADAAQPGADTWQLAADDMVPLAERTAARAKDFVNRKVSIPCCGWGEDYASSTARITGTIDRVSGQAAPFKVYFPSGDDSSEPIALTWPQLLGELPWAESQSMLCQLQPVRRAGRPCDRYLLEMPHPLYLTHVIVPMAKLSIPALAGAPPPLMPPPPPADGEEPESAAAARKRRRFSEYMVAWLVPWTSLAEYDDAGGLVAPPSEADRPQLTYERWLSWLGRLEVEACLFGPREADDDAAGRKRRLIAAGRLYDIENIATGQITDFKRKNGVYVLGVAEEREWEPQHA